MERYDINSKTSYILGISLIVEALKEVPEMVNKVYLSSKANKNKELDLLISLCNDKSIEIEENDLIIDKLSLKENCYGIGIFKKYSKGLETNKHLVLYGFNSEGDLGTILRSAVSFDYKDIVIVNSDIDIYSPKVIRASMGSFFHLNIKQYASIDDYFKEYSYNIYPFTADGSRELSAITFKKPYSIIIPQNYHDLDERFLESYYLKHKSEDIALSSLASIILNYAYHQNVNDTSISGKAL